MIPSRPKLFDLGVALSLCLLCGCSPRNLHVDRPSPTSRNVEPLSDLTYNWPIHPAEALRILTEEELQVRAMRAAGAGVTGAKRITVHVPSLKLELDAKWKQVPSGDLDSWNNSPRKEVAAHVVQSWFLNQLEFVVPSTALRCLPIEQLRRFDPETQPTIPNTRCALGILSLWLDNVAVPDVLFDEARFFDDRAYAHHMANFNLLSYLIEHKDGRAGNFLVSNEASNRRIFAVDNGISFGPWVYNFLVRNWDDIRVPALRRAAVRRLRLLRKSDIQALGVLAEFRPDHSGMLRLVEPGPNLDPSEGTRLRDGIVQLGLTDDELEDLGERVDDLLEDLDRGEISLF